MKETIYTIPVNEVFSEECFCPFCRLYKRLDEEEIRYALGPAMMEPDYRAITNEKGFCKYHIRELNSLPRALAMSLVLQSHFKNMKGALCDNFLSEKKGLFSKKTDETDTEYIKGIEKINHDCAICSKIEHHFLRYIDTFVDMIKKDEEFLLRVSDGSGFCMPHYELVLKACKKKLSGKEYERIVSLIRKAQIRKLEKYERDIDLFVESFDHRNAGKKCEAPSDTVIRASHLLNGEFEKLPKKLGDV
ncbi:MAG: hypothetical protein E7411_00370 [Ruminococcaceae bacterium]|nr:hypothetical protein [Oscillospiraceae bacterium]